MREEDRKIQGFLQTLRIIAATLLIGSVGFMVFAFFHVQANGPNLKMDDGAKPMLTWVSVGFLAVQTVMALVLPPLIERAALARLASASSDKPFALLEVFQQRLILTMALFEGSSFLGSTAYMVEGQPLALGVALAGVVGVATRFPTFGRIVEWLNDRRRTLEQLRARPKG